MKEFEFLLPLYMDLSVSGSSAASGASNVEAPKRKKPEELQQTTDSVAELPESETDDASKVSESSAQMPTGDFDDAMGDFEEVSLKDSAAPEDDTTEVSDTSGTPEDDTTEVSDTSGTPEDDTTEVKDTSGTPEDDTTEVKDTGKPPAKPEEKDDTARAAEKKDKPATKPDAKGGKLDPEKLPTFKDMKGAPPEARDLTDQKIDENNVGDAAKMAKDKGVGFKGDAKEVVARATEMVKAGIKKNEQLLAAKGGGAGKDTAKPSGDNAGGLGKDGASAKDGGGGIGSNAGGEPVRFPREFWGAGPDAENIKSQLEQQVGPLVDQCNKLADQVDGGQGAKGNDKKPENKEKAGGGEGAPPTKEAKGKEGTGGKETKPAAKEPSPFARRTDLKPGEKQPSVEDTARRLRTEDPSGKKLNEALDGLKKEDINGFNPFNNDLPNLQRLLRQRLRDLQANPTAENQKLIEQTRQNLREIDNRMRSVA